MRSGNPTFVASCCLWCAAKIRATLVVLAQGCDRLSDRPVGSSRRSGRPRAPRGTKRYVQPKPGSTTKRLPAPDDPKQSDQLSEETSHPGRVEHSTPPGPSGGQPEHGSAAPSKSRVGGGSSSNRVSIPRNRPSLDRTPKPAGKGLPGSVPKSGNKAIPSRTPNPAGKPGRRRTSGPGSRQGPPPAKKSVGSFPPPAPGPRATHAT